ncbi:MAG TPA: transporter substrate-binding domain-containing protein, partial [Pseudonocardiaceae bacterium]|nr:transporter substrate-binding domain-containing protein [Pseudonocardiaceae bacterium]
VRRIKTFLAFVGALSIVGLSLLTLRACDDEADPGANFGPGPPPATSTTATSGSPTLDKIALRKRLVVSMPRDKPGLSLPGPDGQLTGFDVEIARLVAAGLGLPADAVSFKPVPPSTVDDALASGDVDLAFGGLLTGTPGLEQVGPYLNTSVDVLVPAGSPVTTVDQLAGARVCAISATGDADKLRARAPDVRVTEVAGARQCLTQLRASQAGAIVADDGVLRGLAAADPDAYRLLGAALANQSYSTGVPGGDEVFAAKITEILADAAAGGAWQDAYDLTLGASGVTASPPAPR